MLVMMGAYFAVGSLYDAVGALDAALCGEAMQEESMRSRLLHHRIIYLEPPPPSVSLTTSRIPTVLPCCVTTSHNCMCCGHPLSCFDAHCKAARAVVLHVHLTIEIADAWSDKHVCRGQGLFTQFFKFITVL